MKSYGSAIVLLVSFGTLTAHAGSTNTIGLILNTTNASPGYTLFSSLRYTNTYLINNEGELVNLWRAPFVPGNTHYLLENGNLMRTEDPGPLSTIAAGGDAGMVQEFDWDGNLLWEFSYIDNTHRAHHDIAVLPNGNVLMIAWEVKTKAEAIAAGINPTAFFPNQEIWPEHIIEVQAVGTNSGNIVWEWHVWDHLIQDFSPTNDNFGVVADHPELIDANYLDPVFQDWLHFNAIDYHVSLDQIILSCPFYDEFWVIDHSTTTAEAAGHAGGNSGRGGDILYRWGNPETYGAGTSTDQKLFFQHDVEWIDPGLPGAGNILVYNNGGERPEGVFSTIEEIAPPVDANGMYTNPPPGMAFGPTSTVWTYQASPPEDLFSSGLSGADRLPNGNTLICEGRSGHFLEVTSNSNLVWHYINPVGFAGPSLQGLTLSDNITFRADRYPLDYPAFSGRDLTPKGFVELDPDAVFQFESVSRTASEATFSWVSLPGVIYSLQHTPSLESPAWSNVATVVADGTLTTATDNDPARLNQEPGFYRVVENPD
jgi:hypothetical protein